VINLLQAASIDRRCPVCGGIYRVTLYDVLQQHRLSAEWQSARPTHLEQPPVAAAVPVAELEQLAQAWDALAASLKTKGLEFNIATLPELPHEHAHPQHGEHAQQ
jgi:hypothetical protein